MKKRQGISGSFLLSFLYKFPPNNFLIACTALTKSRYFQSPSKNLTRDFGHFLVERPQEAEICSDILIPSNHYIVNTSIAKLLNDLPVSSRLISSLIRGLFKFLLITYIAIFIFRLALHLKHFFTK